MKTLAGITAGTFAEAYGGLREGLLDAPECAPRGDRIKELTAVNLMVADPRSILCYHPKRGFNVAFGVAEGIAAIAGVNSVKMSSFFSPNAAQFSDDGVTFNGAYGPRVAPFLGRLVAKIKADPDSRQAMVNVFTSGDSYERQTRDVPCLAGFHLLLRDNGLQMHVNMRSNDFFWGLPYDALHMVMIQMAVAHELGVKLGPYFHSASSMHVYERHFGWLEEMDSFQPVRLPELGLGLEAYQSLGWLVSTLAEFAKTRHWDPGLPTMGPLSGAFLVDLLWSFFEYKTGQSQNGLGKDQWAERLAYWLRK